MTLPSSKPIRIKAEQHLRQNRRRYGIGSAIAFGIAMTQFGWDVAAGLVASWLDHLFGK